MKIAAVCITWRRPELLGRLVECFNRQTHGDRELLILDDSGQYPSQPSGDRWRIVSIARRFRTIGEKRNAAAALVASDVAAYAVWDDDDIYLPWALAASVRALEHAEWAQPRQTLEWDDGGGSWHRQQTFNERYPGRIAYHGCWSYRREAFIQVGGYPAAISEDWELARRLRDRYGQSSDTICPDFPSPFYAYSRDSGSYKMSVLGANDRAYETAGKHPFEVVDQFSVRWDRDYAAIPIPDEVRRRPW